MARNGKRLIVGVNWLMGHFEEWEHLSLKEAIGSLYLLEEDWEWIFLEGTVDHHMLLSYIRNPQARQRFQEFARFVITQAKRRKNVYCWPKGDRELLGSALSQLLSDKGLQTVVLRYERMEMVTKRNPGLKVFSTIP